MLEAIQQLGNNISLLVIGIILIVIGIIGPMFAPSGGRGWYALIVIGIIVVVVWLILLLVGFVV